MTAAAEHLELVRATVGRCGWVVQHVRAEGPVRVGFAYTVGLAPAGLPELLISGVGVDASGALLNLVARRALADEVRHGDRVRFPGGETVRLVAADGAPVNFARAMYGQGVGVLQMVWPSVPGGGYPQASGGLQELFGAVWW